MRFKRKEIKSEKEFWLINISNKNVTIADLNISIPANSNVNLLSNHYHLTEEQLEKSLACGSLYSKRDKIYKRIVPPAELKKEQTAIDREAVLNKHGKSIYEIVIPKYEELEVTDDQLAEQNADLELGVEPEKKK